jgi:hypothetical protein
MFKWIFSLQTKAQEEVGLEKDVCPRSYTALRARCSLISRWKPQLQRTEYGSKTLWRSVIFKKYLRTLRSLDVRFS